MTICFWSLVPISRFSFLLHHLLHFRTILGIYFLLVPESFASSSLLGIWMPRFVVYDHCNLLDLTNLIMSLFLRICLISELNLVLLTLFSQMNPYTFIITFSQIFIFQLIGQPPTYVSLYAFHYACAQCVIAW